VILTDTPSTATVELPSKREVDQLVRRGDLRGLMDLRARVERAVPLGVAVSQDVALATVEIVGHINSAVESLTTEPVVLADRVQAAKDVLGLTDAAPATGDFDPPRRAPDPPPRVPPRGEDDHDVARRVRDAKAALHGEQDDDVKSRADEVREWMGAALHAAPDAAVRAKADEIKAAWREGR
jgi:hypothetical protein